MGLEAAKTPPLVCLHGLGRSVHDWDGVEAGLRRYGDVHALALPRGGVDALTTTTVDLPERTILIGHSMAGVVALRSAGGRSRSSRAAATTRTPNGRASGWP